MGGIQAQLCTGSLGDPSAHVTLGKGGNPGPGLPPSVGTYSYVMKTCPDDGEYTLVNTSFDCFNQLWHVIPADHTPNESGGYFMLLNASVAGQDVYVNSFSGLCPNTTYEFAAYIMNVLKPNSCSGDGIDPNLTFKVETTTGTLLASFNTKEIPESLTPNWHQFGVFFSTPPGVTTVICRITNNAPGGCGNDLALDDITISPCGPQVTSRLASNNSDYIDACVNDNTAFVMSSSISPGYQNPAMQWQKSIDGGINWSDIPGAVRPSYTTTPSTVSGAVKYRMIIAESANFGSPQCRIAANPVTINLSGLPFVQATNYVFGCFGNDVALFASGGTTFRWTGPNGFTSNLQHPVIPKVKYSDAGMYRVVVSTAGGCTNSDSTNLDVYPAAHAVINLTRNVSICEGKSITLDASGGVKYRWLPVTGLSSDTIANPVASPLDNTRYTVTVYSDYGCADTASVMVNVIKKPVANAGPDKKTRPGRPVLLNGTVKGTDFSYSWAPSSTMLNIQSLQPSVNPVVDTKYILSTTSNTGCGTSSDEVLVKVYDKVLIPNAFSPNGDGINDSWVIEPLDLFDESVTHVYNRYGEIVYKSNGYVKPWDGTRNGKPLPGGSYYYIIDLRTNNEPKITGSVFIVR
jgi:gliding motility-associated-like protein